MKTLSLATLAVLFLGMAPMGDPDLLGGLWFKFTVSAKLQGLEDDNSVAKVNDKEVLYGRVSAFDDSGLGQFFYSLEMYGEIDGVWQDIGVGNLETSGEREAICVNISFFVPNFDNVPEDGGLGYTALANGKFKISQDKEGAVKKASLKTSGGIVTVGGIYLKSGQFTNVVGDVKIRAKNIDESKLPFETM